MALEVAESLGLLFINGYQNQQIKKPNSMNTAKPIGEIIPALMLQIGCIPQIAMDPRGWLAWQLSKAGNITTRELRDLLRFLPSCIRFAVDQDGIGEELLAAARDAEAEVLPGSPAAALLAVVLESASAPPAWSRRLPLNTVAGLQLELSLAGVGLEIRWVQNCRAGGQRRRAGRE